MTSLMARTIAHAPGRAGLEVALEPALRLADQHSRPRRGPLDSDGLAELGHASSLRDRRYSSKTAAPPPPQPRPIHWPRSSRTPERRRGTALSLTPPTRRVGDRPSHERRHPGGGYYGV